MQIDHLVIGVRDLDKAAARFEDRCGLTTTRGGRHPGWGTANRLIPLGATYLEFVTVVDQAEAANSQFGRWISTMLEVDSRFGWAVRTNDIDGTALRLGLEVIEGSRRSKGGEMLHWRIAGIPDAARDRYLPFFIQWGTTTPLPGRANVVHRAGDVALEELTIEGDEQRLQDWLGTRSLPILVTPGVQGPASFTVRTPANTIAISPDIWG